MNNKDLGVRYFSIEDYVNNIKVSDKVIDHLLYVEEEFIEYIKIFSDTQRPKIINLFEKYKNKNIIIFKNREEAICFLKEENM
jgi:hypothetical protein